MGSIKQKSRVRQKKKQLRRHKRSMLLVGAAIAMLGIAVGVSSFTLKLKNQEYMQQETELKAQIAEEEERAKEVEQFREYVKSDEYIADVAKSKLGLVYPDEIIFKPQK